MSTPHEAIAAWPVTGDADKAAARALSTRRIPYALSSSESAADLVVVDPATGVVPLYLVQDGTLFEYDSLDSTTVASAVCLVTNDGKRYKSGGITPPYSVLTVGTTAQPVSPSIGDTYLIPTAATGTDWSGKDGKIGIYSRAGWQFAISPIGRGLYAEDTNIRWYRNAAGTWVSGFGGLTFESNVFASGAILGAGAAFIRKVENQTTNTAPASPIAPVAYIVGSAPAGAWSAYSPGDLAICNADGVWTRHVPGFGDEVFDKALGIRVQWRGTVWESATGQIITIKQDYRDLVTLGTSVNGTLYNYDRTSPPTVTSTGKPDSNYLLFAAKIAGTRNLEIHYEADIALASGVSAASGNTLTFAVFRGNAAGTVFESNAAAWCTLPGIRPDEITASGAWRLHASIRTPLDAIDTLEHRYFAEIVTSSANTLSNGVFPTTIERRTFKIQERVA